MLGMLNVKGGWGFEYEEEGMKRAQGGFGGKVQGGLGCRAWVLGVVV